MQALPYATQLLGRLGAEVVKVEHPVHGESGRGAEPAMIDPDGRPVGATFLRNNLDKRSLGIDLKSPAGRDLFLRLVPRFDVVAENFKPGTMDRMGLGYDDIAEVAPQAIYLSVSGFGNTGDSPYRAWPAYAAVVEAMSGIYEYKNGPDVPPTTIPVGALGDISSGLFAVIGVLAALRHRDRTGLGQYVDIAMYDAMVSMTDIVTNFWSMGVRPEKQVPVICEGFKASDGYVVIQIVRERAVRPAGRAGRPPRVGRRPALRHPRRLDHPPRRRHPPRHRGVARDPHQAGGVRGADRGGHRGRAQQQRRRRDRRSARGQPPHAGRGAAHRRRGRAAPHPRATR